MKSAKLYKILAIISGILTAAICGVMNFILIPVIEEGVDVRCFDMNFMYSYDDALRFLNGISEHGKEVYLGIQLPLDFVYPIVYFVFFVSVMALLLKKKSLLYFIPQTLFISDIIENICTIKMLKSDVPSVTLVGLASAMTTLKTVMMYLCFLVIIILLIKRIAEKKKQKSE